MYFPSNSSHIWRQAPSTRLAEPESAKYCILDSVCRHSRILKIYIWNEFPCFYSFNLEIFCVSWRCLLVLLLTTTFLVETFFLVQAFFLVQKFSLFKSAWERVSMVNLQYECIWNSAACRGSPSVVYRMMGTGRLAAIPSFLGSLLCDFRKAHLNSLFLSLFLTDEEGHLLLAGAVQAPRKLTIRPPAWKVSWLDFAVLSSETSELNSFEPFKTEILLWPNKSKDSANQALSKSITIWLCIIIE